MVTTRLPVTMRTLPTVVTYNPGAANDKWRNVSLPADSGTPSTLPGDSAVSIYNPQVVGDIAGHQQYIHFTADAEL